MPRTSHIVAALLAIYTSVYGAVAMRDGWDATHLAVSALLAALLIAITLIDVATLRIPDPLTLAVFALGIAVAAFRGWEALMWGLLAAAIGFLILFGVGEFYRRVRGRSGLGFGDVKLFGAAGVWVGAEGLASVLLAGCVAALIALAVARLAGRRVGATTPFPFGPFLSFGFWTTWCAGPLL
ncbi:MAG: A24 family peptidase [Hyphomicrobium sp.]|uniref:prepilin peptidase n=1 Tax=Hyphomicrobium sp. TaxID=82 RepID=UPI003D13757D